MSYGTKHAPLVDQDQLDEVVALCDQTIELAEELGNRELLDQAICYRGGIFIAQGRGEEVVGKLRQVLLQSTCAANSFLAAYNVSQFHDVKEEKERSLFYARLSLDHARKSELPEFIAFACNRIANLLMLDSYFDEACTHYDQALELLPEDHHLDRALTFSNIGYCRVVLGDFTQGFRHLYRSLRLIRERCATIWDRFPRLALSYAYLECERFDRAREHAATALRLSEEAESPQHVKNSLYLLGETEKLSGDEDTAYRHFERLQREFYPDDYYVRDILMATDIRKMINLMA